MLRMGIMAVAATLLAATSAMAGNVDEPLRADGSTALHWAAYQQTRDVSVKLRCA